MRYSSVTCTRPKTPMGGGSCCLHHQHLVLIFSAPAAAVVRHPRFAASFLFLNQRNGCFVLYTYAARVLARFPGGSLIP